MKEGEIYIVKSNMGNCRVCLEMKDLRCGVCFFCSDKVTGKKIPGGHLLWEINNPQNKWFFQDDWENREQNQ
jgi:hypothetical protein